MNQDELEKNKKLGSSGKPDVDNVVDMAIFRMKSGAVEKEERKLKFKQTFKFVAIGATVLAGLVAFSQLDFVYQKPVSETAKNGDITITLNQHPSGHYFAKGKINGENMDFLLDTGATNVAIPMDIAKKLDLPIGQKFTTKTANGDGVGYVTKIRSISLGDITLTGVDASISPGLDQILLGMSFLTRTKLEQEDGVMRITY